MSKIMSVMGQFRDDEDGAAMVEYTILLGDWVGDQWAALERDLDGKGDKGGGGG